jgi:hypothetical protein
MNGLTGIQAALLLLEGVLASLGKNAATENTTEIVEDVSAAIANIQKYAGTDVTFPQLEAMKLTPQW